MAAALTAGQKRMLAGLAERAFNRQAALARGRGEVVDDSREARDAWRHQEVAKASGRAGLRCCDQNNFGEVKGHFLALLGEDGQALRAMVHGQAEANERRVVEWKIVELLRELGRPLTYAEGVCRRMHRGKCLAEVDDRGLWKVFFALRYQR